VTRISFKNKALIQIIFYTNINRYKINKEGFQEFSKNKGLSKHTCYRIKKFWLFNYYFFTTQTMLYGRSMFGFIYLQGMKSPF